MKAQKPQTRTIFTKEETDAVIRRVSLVSIGGNVALSGFKLAAGLVGHSGAMISDAVHSLSDVFTTFIALLGVRLAGKGADADHPYGHERLECIASLVLAALLVITGAGIGYAGLSNILRHAEIAIPGTVALWAAALSIAGKEAMFWYTLKNANKIGSAAFRADAWHHRSDALSSVGALIGIGGARLGYPIMDSLASLVICLFVFKVAIDICRDALDKMVDKACPKEFEEELKTLIQAEQEVKSLDKLKTRMFGERVYVDAEIALDPAMSLDAAHAVAQRVHDRIERTYPQIKHIMIHMNPAKY